MIQLFINDNIVDIGLAKDLNVKLNRAFIDLQNIESRSGDYSYTIKLPKTKRNNIVFSNINVTNVVNKFVKTEEYSYRLTVDGINFEGIFKITSIDDLYYNGVLLSANISWAKLLQGKNLNELKNQDGSNWIAPFIGSSGSTALNSLQWYIANTDYDSSDICFPFVSYGNYFHGANIGETNYIFDDSLTYIDLPPAVYQLKVVKKIFDNIGWNCDSTLFSNPEHKKLILPFTTSDTYTYADSLLVNSISSGGTDYVQQEFGGAPANSFDVNYGSSAFAPHVNICYLKPTTVQLDPSFSLNQITIHDANNNPKVIVEKQLFVTGYYNIKLSLNLQPIASASPHATGIDCSHFFSNTYDNTANFRGGIFLYIHDENNDYYKDVFDNIASYIGQLSSTVTHPAIIAYYDIFRTPIDSFPTFFQPFDPVADIVVTDSLSYTYSNYISNGTNVSHFKVQGGVDFDINNIYLGQDEKIRAAVVTYAVSNLGGINNFHVNIHDCNWSFTAANTDSGLNIGRNLPAISQLEFIKTWMNMNNLFLTSDFKNKTVRFDTYDSFFLPVDYGYDITSKVDLNKDEPPIKPLNLPTNIFFKYNNDTTDVLLESNPDYGNLQVTSDNIYTSGDKEISYLYSATKYRDFILDSVLNFTGTTGLTISVPSIANEQSFNVDDLTSIQWSLANSPRILKTNGYMADISGNTLYISVDGYQTALINTVFEDVRENHLNLANNGENGIYNTSYERYLNDISDSHILAVNSKINGTDYNAMQPQVPILINNSAYIINQINAFDPINNGSVTKLELIKRFNN